MQMNDSAKRRDLAWASRRHRPVALVVCWMLALAASEASAHPDRDEQIARLTLALEKNPADATLWLRRGEVRRQYRQFELALTDLGAEIERGVAVTRALEAFAAPAPV